jgi:hypothetical protein
MKYKGVSIDSISMFSTPGIYLQLTGLLLKDAFSWLKNFILTRGLLLFLITIAYILIANVDALQVPLLPRRPSKTCFTSSPIGSCWEWLLLSDWGLDCIPSYSTLAPISPRWLLPLLTADTCQKWYHPDGILITLSTVKVSLHSCSKQHLTYWHIRHPAGSTD